MSALKYTVILSILIVSGILWPKLLLPQTVTTPRTVQVQPTWVPDPSFGHFDCPDGWIAYERSEPYPPFQGSTAAVYIAPPHDAKGHVLNPDKNNRKAICIKESQ
jgi:hypothetical protein